MACPAFWGRQDGRQDGPQEAAQRIIIIIIISSIKARQLSSSAWFALTARPHTSCLLCPYASYLLSSSQLWQPERGQRTHDDDGKKARQQDPSVTAHSPSIISSTVIIIIIAAAICVS